MALPRNPSDPARDTEPFDASSVSDQADANIAKRLFTDGSEADNSANRDDLPGRLNSFEDELKMVGQLNDSTLAQPTNRVDAHAQGDVTAQKSETAERWDNVAAEREDGVEYRAEGRNPLAEAVFAAEPHGDGPRTEFPNTREVLTSDVVVGERQVTDASLVSEDPRTLRYPPGPQPNEYLSDVNPESTDRQAVVGDDSVDDEAEEARQQVEDLPGADPEPPVVEDESKSDSKEAKGDPADSTESSEDQVEPQEQDADKTATTLEDEADEDVNVDEVNEATDDTVKPKSKRKRS